MTTVGASATPLADMEASARNATIDCLRGLSAVSVALFHFNALHAPYADWYHRTLKFGWLGVTVFFVLSGYCIAHARQRDTVAAFWSRRLLRIYPPLWGSLLLILAIVAIRKAMTGVNDVTMIPRGWSGFIYTVSRLTNPASSVEGMNWVYWSLAFEIAFYIAMGVVFARASIYAVLGFGVVALLLCDFYPFSEWGKFALGISAYYFSVERPRACVALATLSLAHIALARSAVELSVAAIAFALILYGPSMLTARVFAPLRYAGDISYSLYLTHVPLGCYVGGHLLGNASGNLAAGIGRDAMLLIICVAGAVGFYRVVERPAHAVARRWPKRPALARGHLPIDAIAESAAKSG